MIDGEIKDYLVPICCTAFYSLLANNTFTVKIMAADGINTYKLKRKWKPLSFPYPVYDLKTAISS